MAAGPEGGVNRLTLWLRLARAPYVVLAVAPILVGTAYALYDAFELRLVPLVLALVGGATLFLGAMTIVAILEITLGREPLTESGSPSRAQGPEILGAGLVSLPEAAGVGAVTLAVALGCGALLVRPVGSFAIGLGFAGLMIAIFYGVPGVGLRDLGHGFPQLAAFAGLGLVPVLGGYAAQSGAFTVGAAIASLPLGFYGAAIAHVHDVHRFSRDPEGASTSIVAILGEDQARLGMWLLPIFAYLAIAVNVTLGEYPRTAWCAFATAPVLAFVLARLDASDEAACARLTRMTAILCAMTGLIIAVAIAAAGARAT